YRCVAWQRNHGLLCNADRCMDAWRHRTHGRTPAAVWLSRTTRRGSSTRTRCVLATRRADRAIRCRPTGRRVMQVSRKGLCGAALALATGSAAAQPSVTLYGVADTFVQYLDNGGTHSVSERSGGSTGSLFGLKGSEDLGGGLKANFDVETGFNINNGA